MYFAQWFIQVFDKLILYSIALFFVFIDFREGSINLLLHLFMHSLIDSCMCRDGFEPTTTAYQDNALTN